MYRGISGLARKKVWVVRDRCCYHKAKTLDYHSNQFVFATVEKSTRRLLPERPNARQRATGHWTKLTKKTNVYGKTVYKGRRCWILELSPELGRKAGTSEPSRSIKTTTEQAILDERKGVWPDKNGGLRIKDAKNKKKLNLESTSDRVVLVASMDALPWV